MFGNGKPEPGAAELARGAAFRLLERGKQPGLLFAVDSNPRIRHLNLNLAQAVFFV